MKNQLIRILAGFGIVAVGSAGANTITPTTSSFAPGSSITYSADLTSGEMHSGDGFTIFDIAGFTGFGAIPANWTATSSLSGSTFGVPLGPDDAALTNVTFTYGGAAVEQGFGQLILGSFVVNTTATLTVTDDWVSRDHLLGVQGVIDGAIGPGDRGSILVPSITGNTITVPDGGNALILFGAALAALGVLRRRTAK